MDFDFNDDQKALREAVRDALAGMVPAGEMLAMVGEGGRMPDGLWRQIADLGWPGLLIPEEHGGLGLGLVDMTVVCEEMGRVPLPGPYFSSAVFATSAALRLGADELLADLASGAKRGTVAVEEMAVAGDPLVSVRTRATRDGGGWVLDGLKPAVADGPTADWVIVVAHDGDGLAGFLVEGADIEPVPGLDPTRQLGRLAMSGTTARRLGPAGDQTGLLRRIVDDAAVMLCAELIGASEATFELAAEYSKARVQFGRPIGTFQAVKHLAAEMLQELTLARVITHYAAWCSDVDDDDRELAASMAKSYAPEAAIAVTSTSIQIHGAVGFTWECPAHFYYKRAKATDLMLGKQGWQRHRVADLILGTIPA
ncbi:MAG TPA: acyl-CoA dehydrogenase family protein [Mycobacteriales bacterium]|nr:acyl-CoA dehydrogenase family protein [Mycobacteriales bacterium]HWA65020.1 acyl-CoA dehydrogenase family protein [Mycobacteriales bacterium]